MEHTFKIKYRPRFDEDGIWLRIVGYDKMGIKYPPSKNWLFLTYNEFTYDADREEILADKSVYERKMAILKRQNNIIQKKEGLPKLENLVVIGNGI